MTDRELLQQALDALQLTGIEYLTSEEIDRLGAFEVALRARLAQPEPYPENFIDALRFDAAQSEPMIDGWPLWSGLPKPEPEPVAWISHNAGLYHGKPDESLNPLPLYTAPPKKEWVGLTDEEIREGNKDSWVTRQAWESAAWWAEAKLKEKNT